MQGMNSEFDYSPLRQRRFALPADADCVGDADLRFCAILTHLSVSYADRCLPIRPSVGRLNS